MSEYKLTEEIVKRSQAQSWNAAKLEWNLDHIYEADEPETCLCGHFPIVEICILRNKVNGQSATVGNCCVKMFIGLPSDLIFQAVKRARKDISKALNAEAIQHAFDKGWINKWEYDFSLNTMRKKVLSAKQHETRVNINNKVMANMKRQKNG